MDPTTVILAVGGLLGPSGLIWVALRFNREDAKAAVSTMREVAEELRLDLDRAREQGARESAVREKLESALELAYEERGRLEHEVGELRIECANLRREVTLLRESNEAAQ